MEDATKSSETEEQHVSTPSVSKDVDTMDSESEGVEDDDDFRQVPVTILTGFLGSGKTTLLNRILTEFHGKKIAVIENEFGEIGIDDKLVRKRMTTTEEIFEMNNGCICCTVRGDLIRIVGKLLRKADELDGIIIETTGLADPGPVVQTFFMDEEIKELARLDAVITVIDAKHVLQHLDEVKKDGAENEAVEQVAFADVMLLNKMDLVEKEYADLVEDRLKEINQYATLMRCQQSNVPIDKIINVRAFELERIVEMEPRFLVENKHKHGNDVFSVGIEMQGSMDIEKLNAWMGNLLQTRGPDIFRMKGVLNIHESDEKFVFQGIHMIFTGEPLEEWQENEARVNRIVFIGRNLSEEDLRSGLETCIVPE